MFEYGIEKGNLYVTAVDSITLEDKTPEEAPLPEEQQEKLVSEKPEEEEKVVIDIRDLENDVVEPEKMEEKMDPPEEHPAQKGPEDKNSIFSIFKWKKKNGNGEQTSEPVEQPEPIQSVEQQEPMEQSPDNEQPMQTQDAPGMNNENHGEPAGHMEPEVPQMEEPKEEPMQHEHHENHEHEHTESHEEPMHDVHREPDVHHEPQHEQENIHQEPEPPMEQAHEEPMQEPKFEPEHHENHEQQQEEHKPEESSSFEPPVPEHEHHEPAPEQQPESETVSGDHPEPVEPEQEESNVLQSAKHLLGQSIVAIDMEVNKKLKEDYRSIGDPEGMYFYELLEAMQIENSESLKNIRKLRDRFIEEGIVPSADELKSAMDEAETYLRL
jgi:hypothetical protein